MASLEAELFVSNRVAPLSGSVGFAEPDWQGDRDYQGALCGADLDQLVASLADLIAVGRGSGRLDTYVALRATFDLQAIKGRIAHHRATSGAVIAPDRQRALLSRLDRLGACLGYEIQPITWLSKDHRDARALQAA